MYVKRVWKIVSVSLVSSLRQQNIKAKKIRTTIRATVLQLLDGLSILYLEICMLVSSANYVNEHFTPNIGECILISNFNSLESQALGSIYISIFNKNFSIISSLYPLFIAFVSIYSYNLMVTAIVYIL